MTLVGLTGLIKFFRFAESGPEYFGNEEFLQYQPGRRGCFIAIQRVFLRHHFAVAAQISGRYLYQDTALFIFTTEAGFKEMNIRNFKLDQLDSLYGCIVIYANEIFLLRASRSYSATILDAMASDEYSWNMIS